MVKRQHLGVIDDSAISFVDFADEWWKRVAHTLKPRTQERWKGIVEKHLKPAFPGSLRAISVSQVEAYRAKRDVAGAAPATINREVDVLKHMTSRAVAWEYIAADPLAGRKTLRALKEPKGRVRYLLPEEIERLLAACDAVGEGAELAAPYLRTFALVALNTGMRRNEILGLERRSIDWPHRTATLEETKNGERRVVRLNPVVIEALRALPPRLHTPRLFPFKANQVSQAFMRAVRRAGITDFRLHDCRHTFASYQAMSGTVGRGLQDLLGHKDGRMTERYTHIADKYLMDAVDRVQLGAATAEPMAPVAGVS
ncbi:MAG: tyrosine-type recombinase/integrase [Thermodesulfobacteriota bacterium]